MEGGHSPTNAGRVRSISTAITGSHVRRSAAGASQASQVECIGAGLALLLLVGKVVLASLSGVAGAIGRLEGYPVAVFGARTTPTATPVPIAHASLWYCAQLNPRDLDQQHVCNNGQMFDGYTELENQSNNATAQWTISFSPSSWTASPSGGTLGPNANTVIRVTSPASLISGQLLTVSVTCAAGSGTPCPVGGWFEMQC